MKRLRTAWLGAAALCMLLAGAANAQEPPILNHTFEENDGGWHAFGGTAELSLTHEPAAVKSGKGALQLSYALKKGDFEALALPTPDQVLSKAKSFRFWVKTDHATSLSLVLQEKDGGRYNALFFVPKETWQQVELSTADFALDLGKDAPKDPDGKLDMEDVESVAIADMAQIFVQDPNMATALGVSEGPRKLYLDDFAVTTAALAPSTSLKHGEGTFDLFVRPQIAWVGVGDITVTKATGKPLDGAGLQAKYHQAPGHVSGLMRYLPPDSLTGAGKITLSAASLKPAKLLIQLEERSGGKYNTVVELPGGSGRSDLTLALADFKAADDSHDDNGKLDVDQVTQMVVMDLSGILDQIDTDNTIWLGNIKAAR